MQTEEELIGIDIGLKNDLAAMVRVRRLENKIMLGSYRRVFDEGGLMLSRGFGKAMRRISISVVVIVGALEGISPRWADAATFNVNAAVDDSDASPGDGVCSTGAGSCTLRAAVQEANALAGKDTINIPAGTYTVSGRVQVQDSVDLFGVDAATTIVSGGSAHPLFQVMQSGTGAHPLVSIHRMTLRDGYGGLGERGVALYNMPGATTKLWDSIVRDNESNIYGGGISNYGYLYIIRSEIRNNRLPEGGGGVTSAGGGIFNAGTLEIACSAVTENFATRGGGINNNNGILKIKESTISSNRALGGGGGIRNVGDSRLYIASTTVTLNRGNEGGQNEPRKTGAGVQTLAPATVWIGGSILAGNIDNRSRFDPLFSPDCFSDNPGNIVSMRSNLFGVVNSQCPFRDSITGTTTSFDLKGTDTVPLDPKLDPIPSSAGSIRVHALQVASPAIDGNTATPNSGIFSCDAIDQRGSARPTDGDGNGQAACDIGAFEREVSSSAVNPAACDALQFAVGDTTPPMAPGSLQIR